MIAAAYLEDLDASTKLVLMAVADSADEHTLEAAPGLPKLRAWSGLGRSQTLAVVAALRTPVEGVRPRYLEHVAQGRKGRRAVYRVFPEGLPIIPHPTEVAARYELSTTGDNPVDNLEGQGPADWTLDLSQGPAEASQGPAQTGPLHASTSVSSARRGTPTPRASVDKPTSSASTGFPGARSQERPDPRTARGFHDQPCPLHPSEVVPCGRCANAAADPATVQAAAAEARAKIRGAR
jgi:hypothetical protein